VNHHQPVLFFCAFSDKKKNGVQRYSEEMIKGVKLREASTFAIYWQKENGYFKSFIHLCKDYIHTINKVKIVHFVVLTPFNVPFLLVAKILRKKIITTYHGNHIAESPIPRRLHILLVFLIADVITRILSDKIISATEYLASKLKLGKKNLMLIPYPVEIDRLNDQSKSNTIKPSQIVFAAASNFNIAEKIEGLKFLFDAMSKIEQRNDLKLLIFGHGKYLDEFEQKYRSSKNIIFMGFRNDFGEYLRNADVYIHISGLDNQPYAIIDALMKGKVVVCNALGGILETIDRKYNYVVKLDSVSIYNALSEVLSEIKNDYKSFQEKGYKNKIFATNKYSSEFIITQYIQLYHDLLKNK
jgi:glycosyltransferase involved in cell wall biosynthesis